ncbi:MAG: threonine synthase [Bacteroidota bacterium]
MKYVSTRGESPAATFRDALFAGLPPDGGLYVPETFPRLPDRFVKSLGALSLDAICREILSLFIDDVPPDELSGLLARAWNFPIPLKHLEDNLYLLELFHGPTLAFKDVGARFLAETLSHYLAQAVRDVSIAVATSGDTGSAVAHGFFGVKHIRVYVLYPSGRISRLQEQQMATLGENIVALEVEGTFDDCQALVKRALADTELARAINLTTANSMNLGRLIPQIVYYVWGIAQWQEKSSDASHRRVDGFTVVVPSGNFGNLTAAAYAQEIGAPIRQLVAATNANDVVPRYLDTGRFEPGESLQTYSNAMDVGSPSNVARLQALVGGRIDELRRRIRGVSISDEETLAEMRRTYERTGAILDPHTAVGVAAARREGGSDPIIVVATAHPAKFPEVVQEALGFPAPLPQRLQECLGRPKKSVPLPADYGAFRAVLTRNDPS